MRRIVVLLALLTMLVSSSSAAAGTTLFVREYASTDLPAGPPPEEHHLLGQFGAEYESTGRLRFNASFETNLSTWRGNGAFRLASTFFHAGLRYDLTDRVLIEVKHGSFHANDTFSRGQQYNRIGVEWRLP